MCGQGRTSDWPSICPQMIAVGSLKVLPPSTCALFVPLGGLRRNGHTAMPGDASFDATSYDSDAVHGDDPCLPAYFSIVVMQRMPGGARVVRSVCSLSVETCRCALGAAFQR